MRAPRYIQGGPALLDGTTDTNWGVSGKTSKRSYGLNTDVYGEVGFADFADSDTSYGIKMGFKSKL